MRLPYADYQHAVETARAKAAASGANWYVNRLASSGTMRYEVSSKPMDTTFGGGTVCTVFPPAKEAR